MTASCPQNWTLRGVAPPATPLVSLADMYQQCRLDPDFNQPSPAPSPAGRADDPLIQQGIDSATSELCDFNGTGWLGTGLTNQEYELSLDALPAGALRFPIGPLQSVSAITYTDNDGVVQTIDPADYRVFPARGLVLPLFGQSWPSGRVDTGAVTVRFVAGYGPNPEDVPAIVKQWIMIRAATFYEIREGVVVGTIIATVPSYPDALENHRNRREYKP